MHSRVTVAQIQGLLPCCWVLEKQELVLDTSKGRKKKKGILNSFILYKKYLCNLLTKRLVRGTGWHRTVQGTAALLSRLSRTIYLQQTEMLSGCLWHLTEFSFCRCPSRTPLTHQLSKEKQRVVYQWCINVIPCIHYKKTCFQEVSHQKSCSLQHPFFCPVQIE